MLPKNSFRSYIDDKLKILADDKIPKNIQVNTSIIKAKPPIDRMRLPFGNNRIIKLPPEAIKPLRDFYALSEEERNDKFEKGEIPKLNEQYFYRIPKDKRIMIFADTFQEWKQMYEAKQKRWHAHLEKKRRIYEGDEAVDSDKNFPIHQEMIKIARAPIKDLKPNPNKAAPKKEEQKPDGDKKVAETGKKDEKKPGEKSKKEK